MPRSAGVSTIARQARSTRVRRTARNAANRLGPRESRTQTAHAPVYEAAMARATRTLVSSRAGAASHRATTALAIQVVPTAATTRTTRRRRTLYATPEVNSGAGDR